MSRPFIINIDCSPVNSGVRRFYLKNLFWGSGMSKSGTYIAVSILLAAVLLPQIIVSAQNSQKPRKVVVKKDGWLIPGLDDFKQVSKVVRKNIEGVTVTQKVLDASTEIIVDVDGNRVKPYVRRKSNGYLLSIRGFSIYESNGRVFAYGVDLVPVFFVRGKNYWSKTYAGAMYNLFYVDEDSDGIFESRYAGLPLRQLPDWVRRNGRCCTKEASGRTTAE